jgi:predicted MFS family arabinose efflux permease
MNSPLYPHIPERFILLLVASAAFVNILDFMMVLPLGPDFAPALGITNADLGWVGGSYTAASAVSGLIASLFIDRFDRKSVLLWALAGIAIATALGGGAWDLTSLLATRIIAGIFGGPAISICWSIVADVVEPARRGQAMGKVMGAFSLAAVFGVPFGLEIAHLANWRAPFFATALMIAIIIIMTFIRMPSMRAHLIHGRVEVSVRHLVALLLRPLNALTYFYILCAMLAGFMIVPNISAYVQYNLHYPRAMLGWLYAAGGTVSFLTMRATGIMIDRYTASATSLISNLTFIGVLWIVFIHPWAGLPVMAIFTLFMFAMGMRNLSSTTLATKLPTPQERAGFMSLMSCIQGIGMASGAFLSTRLLSENADHSLIGMDHLALIAATLTCVVPITMRVVEKRLQAPQ